MTISLGILAGMGPRSTAPFIDRLIADCHSLYGAVYDMDFPKMHIISLPTPFWPGEKINDSAMVAALKQGLNDLVQARVSLIGIPCNLAHGYFDEIKESCGGIELLHIAETAIAALPKNAKNIALLATEPTLEAGFYQKRLGALGKNFIDTQSIRQATTQLITQIKLQGFYHANVLKQWHALLVLVESQPVDAVLIACTELSPLLGQAKSPLTLIDTAESLSRAMIERYSSLAGHKPLT